MLYGRDLSVSKGGGRGRLGKRLPYTAGFSRTWEWPGRYDMCTVIQARSIHCSRIQQEQLFEVRVFPLSNIPEDLIHTYIQTGYITVGITYIQLLSIL
jgi:hypothetical protein